MAMRLVLAVTLLLSLLASFDARTAAPTRALDRLPRLVLWAWERPVDLRGLAADVGVAFLAQTITSTARASIVLPRRQPLLVGPATSLIAVTRIEMPGGEASAPVDDIARAIASTVRLPRVAAIQIDFDATLSQRPMYRQLLYAIRRELPRGTPLSITALASWCMQDPWLGDLPIDEAVPMLFRMGPAEGAAPLHLRAPACDGAIGTSLDEPLRASVAGRRVYVFNARPWTDATVAAARNRGTP
jgi:hypothetical protein